MDFRISWDCVCVDFVSGDCVRAIAVVSLSVESVVSLSRLFSIGELSLFSIGDLSVVSIAVLSLSAVSLSSVFLLVKRKSGFVSDPTVRFCDIPRSKFYYREEDARRRGYQFLSLIHI